MSYLRFEKALMTNLQESLPKEVLRTNRSGAYSCTTIVDCNIRKYHGLLVVPIPELDEDNHVLLSSLDVTVIQHGAEFNLGLHKYQGNHFSPNGHKYIKEFDCDTVPTTIYRVGGVLLKKEVLFQHYEDRILLKYTLLDAHSSTTLRFRPFLAFRSVREFTHENGYANREYLEVDNGIKTCMYPGYPELYMQFNKKNEFVFHPDWYRGVEYPKEQERGYYFNEDLYVPGYFEMNIRKGESIVFSASTSEIKSSKLKKMFDEEKQIRSPRDNFFHCLINAAHQFHLEDKVSGETYLLAGYPWFKVRARDTFIALPGLTLGIEEHDYFEKVMDTAAKGIMDFIEGRPLSVKIYEMDKPDVLLWAIWSLQQFAYDLGRDIFLKKYKELARAIIDFYLENRHPYVKFMENGLLCVEGGDQTPMTWMNSVSGGRPVVPRNGYIVEVNALWYNALCFCAELAEYNEDEEARAKLAGFAERCKVSFGSTFLNQCGYLFDYVDGEKVDWSVRPNMLFPVAFDYSPLTNEQQKNILDMVTRELLTPKGLRSLSPKSDGYRPIYAGPQSQRDLAYHQGTAWPWLFGFYAKACLKLYKQSRLSFLERLMVGFEDEMTQHCVGTISELYDGNPPFKSRGAISFAANVAEILEASQLLEKYRL